MFAADGTMLHCTQKSDLIDIIQEIVEGDVYSDSLDEVVIKPVVKKCVFGVVRQVMKMSDEIKLSLQSANDLQNNRGLRSQKGLRPFNPLQKSIFKVI